MARKKLPPAKDWRARELKDWTATTFHEYMKHLHKETYGTSYVIRDIKVHNACIKRMYEEYGKEVTKRFIELCFKNYKPSGKYAGANFMFFYTYLRERYLPIAEKQIAKEQKLAEQKEQQKVSDDDINKIIDLF